jgi:hypothetical protein
MCDYSKTKIYRIPVGDMNYYGYTTQPLHKREQQHKRDREKCLMRKLYRVMRWNGMEAEHIKLILVEEFPCETKQQALERERYWIEKDGKLNFLHSKDNSYHFYDKLKRELKKQREDKMRVLVEIDKQMRQHRQH